MYKTKSDQGAYVTFFHNNHSNFYGLICKDCHREEPCVACHYQKEKPVSIVDAQKDAMHYKCSACHDTESKSGCVKCHSKKEIEVFDHEKATGWALNIYHNKLNCNSCHPEGKKLTRLDKTRNNCHSNWNSENFNHAITGVRLDEIHIQAECSDCHVDRRFDKKPGCSTCHDKDKIYPRDKPGKVTKKGR